MLSEFHTKTKKLCRHPSLGEVSEPKKSTSEPVNQWTVPAILKLKKFRIVKVIYNILFVNKIKYSTLFLNLFLIIHV